MSEHTVIPSGAPASDLLEALRSGRDAIVAADGVSAEVADLLLDVCRRPGVATSSPVPVPSVREPTVYETADDGPGPPTVALPYPDLCAVSGASLASLGGAPPLSGSAADAVLDLGERLFRHGWRNVGTPGLAMDWDPAARGPIHAVGGWTRRAIAELVGPANTSLETHRTWARTRVEGVTVVVDGACITHSPFTGTQHLVIEIAKWLASTRPRARVMLATHQSGQAVARRELGSSQVIVTSRSRDIDCDVVYRPYQMLFAEELDFVLNTGRRGLVGQLDMIGFANAFYHPSDQLWFFARNLQRFLMRSMDGVTFISEFGRDSASMECPDLEADRLHVVSCGADPNPIEGEISPARGWPVGRRFITCLSSTFAHKNRTHALVTFDALVRHHGYDGHLIMGGPEPYYGRSLDEEDDVLARLQPGIRKRVHRWGHVSDNEKWWLLRHADAVLYPSVVEGFGLVPFEAAAVGTVCLTHHSAAPAELLGSTGATIDSWVVEDWAARLFELLGSVEARETTLEAVRRVARVHSWERSAERTWDAIERTLSRPRRVSTDEGGPLCAIASPHRRMTLAPKLRFNIARSIPFARRRLLGVARRTRTMS